jgi:hypothetical protein
VDALLLGVLERRSEGQRLRARRRGLRLPEVLADVNARISKLASEQNGDAGERWEFVCECGRPGCEKRVLLSVVDYETLVRKGRAVIAEGHGAP